MGIGNSWREANHYEIPSTLSFNPAKIEVAANSRVLDLGCGPQPNNNTLLGQCPEVTHIDLNMGALVHARKHARSHAFVCADALALPFVGKCFDLVLCKALLTVVVDDEQCLTLLNESHRVLREGGNLLLCDFLMNENDQYFTERYQRGKDLGMHHGAFITTDHHNNALYAARHFTSSWIFDQFDRRNRWAINTYTETVGLTRTGRQIDTFTLYAQAL